MSWQRARSPEQKEKRRSDLLEAAAELFAKNRYDRVSLAAIAAQAGISKANVYRYFDSKEEIYLTLLLQDLQDWVARLEQGLAPHAGCNDPELVAKVYADSMLADTRLVALTSLLAGVLETNVNKDTLITFKRAMIGESIGIANAVYAALPDLGPEGAQAFLTLSYQLSSGLWPIAHPSTVVKEVLAMPEFQQHSHDFDRDIRNGMAVLLHGLLARSRG